MKFQSCTPMLWTAELEATIEFYTQILGFTCGEYNESWGWAALHREGCELMLAKPNVHTPFDKPSFTGSFYFKITEVEMLWDHLKDKARVEYELETFEWGMKEFAIYDNNGYLLQFGEEVIG